MENKHKNDIIGISLMIVFGLLLILLCAYGLHIFASKYPIETSETVSVEQPHMYWKEINVIVDDIDKKTWYASTHHYKVNITVHSDEYGLVESFEFNGGDAKDVWDYDKGDVIKAELHLWVMDSTGEVVRREIGSLN